MTKQELTALATDLATSFVNGNRYDVVEEVSDIAKADAETGLALMVAVAVALPTLEDARRLSAYLNEIVADGPEAI